MLKSKIRNVCFRFFRLLIPELNLLTQLKEDLYGKLINTVLDAPVKLYPPFTIYDSKIGKFSYISERAIISQTTIGRFCSIGPNLLCGWGIHPLDGISTSPMFYSTLRQNGFSLVKENKIEERKKITIGNDVFIGANVTILDGVTIGDGAVIGAGCVVNKDVPCYAIVAGVPMGILRYRFREEEIQALQRINWWNGNDNELQQVEQYFFNVEEFISAKVKVEEFDCLGP